MRTSTSLTSPTGTAPKSWVALAEVARPHGVKGELRLKLYNPDSAVLLRKPRIRLVTADGARAIKLRSVRRVPKALLVRLDGIGDRDAAETLRGARIEVEREELEPVADDEFYICDLIGCRVTLDGEELGRVEHVANYPTCDALVINKRGGGRLEVPLNAHRVGPIDIAAKHVIVTSIEGLE